MSGGAIEVLDLFSAAAGGWSLGLHRAGFTTIAACEVEAWRRALYSENNPAVKVYDDVRTLTADRLRADLGRLPVFVVGSPPCQDISTANTKGKGVEGARSGLYFEAIRIVGEVRPRWFALENSANLRTRGADAVIAALEALGYACWPVVVRAGDIGANHERPRAWLIGCDLEQVADPDGNRWDEGRIRGRSGFDASVSPDPQHTAGVGHEGGRSWGHGPYGDRAPSVAERDARHPAQDGRGQRIQRRCAVTIERLPIETCGYAANPTGVGCGARTGGSEGGHDGRDRSFAGDSDAHGDASHANRDGEHALPVNGEVAILRRMAGDREPGNAADPDQARQARQAHGCVESGLRQAEIANDGRGAGRRDDGSGARQMGVCAPDRSAAVDSGPGWSLANLADHLRLDDGLSARLAGTRVAVGGPKGISAASLVVEAFGDAVVPQIPEAIGRAILRTEQALAVVYGRMAE